MTRPTANERASDFTRVLGQRERADFGTRDNTNNFAAGRSPEHQSLGTPSRERKNTNRFGNTLTRAKRVREKRSKGMPCRCLGRRSLHCISKLNMGLADSAEEREHLQMFFFSSLKEENHLKLPTIVGMIC